MPKASAAGKANQHHATLAAPVHPSTLTSCESSTVRKALAIIESKRLKNADVLYYLEDFWNYLRLRFAGLVHEQGHVVYLDVDHHLIDADTMAFGDQRHVTWNIRHIVYRALALGAEHIVLAHNHPNDNAMPSDADVQNLIAFERGLSMVGINLLDSFVVTSKKITSIKNYRENEKKREFERWERERLERKAKRAANKAAKLAAQQQSSEPSCSENSGCRSLAEEGKA